MGFGVLDSDEDTVIFFMVALQVFIFSTHVFDVLVIEGSMMFYVVAVGV